MNIAIRRAALIGALALASPFAVHAQDGTFDPGFNASGRGLYQSNGLGSAIAAQSSGKLIIAGDCQTQAGPQGICVNRLKLNGEPDYGVFNGGNNTKILGNYGDTFPGEQKCALHGLALQADDRIVLASYDANADLGNAGQSRLTRLHEAGLFETLASGKVYVPVVFQAGSSNPASTNSVASAVAIAPDGKIVVAGGARYYNPSSGQLIDWDMGVARFNVDMTPDTSFVINGGRTISFDQGGDNFDTAKAVAVQRDGKIVLVGVARSAGGNAYVDAALVRLNVNGTEDASFGSGGKVTLPAFSTAAGLWHFNSVNAVAIDRRGGILIAGSILAPDGSQQMFVARFEPNGVLDNYFGVRNLWLYFNDVRRNEAFGLTLQGDGNILVYGSADTNTQNIPASYWLMYRLMPNGEIDDSFGNGTGRAYGGYNPPPGAVTPPNIPSNDARGAVIANGGVNLIGRAFDYYGNGGSYFGVAKLQIDAIFKDGFDP